MGRHRGWAAGLAAVAGFAAGVGVTAGRWATAQAPPAAAAPADDPPYRGLDANLYMQTAAEYRACCLQAYNLAADRLRAAVAAKAAGDRKPAVVLDLDETVLDNAGFQADQLRAGRGFDLRAWDRWEETGADRVGLIPGAKEFVAEAGRLGVTPVYISNRNARSREQTTAALRRLGLPLANDADLKLADRSTGSDKTSRRAEAERDYAVLLYVGDNLRDFDERFRFPDLAAATGEGLDAAVRARKAAVDAARDRWGTKWVILPNPAYGEWAKPLGRGRADLDRLVPAAKER
jgi:acid phosphatase